MQPTDGEPSTTHPTGGPSPSTPDPRGRVSRAMRARASIRPSRSQLARGLARCAGVILLVLLLAGCGGTVDIPATLRTPEVAGVVVEAVRLPDGGRAYRLADGASADIPSQKEVLLGGEPLVGELLLAGTDPDGRRWVAEISLSTAIGRPPGCFDFPDQGRARDGWIETNSGFRLPRASDFTDARDYPNDEFASDRGVFCLNERGEVTSYAIG